jgi:endogenous inhibitor of DNA gyrase (YacG/DUF329 family)
MQTAVPRVPCPTCQRELSWSEQFPWRPFCSERCKMVDLGAWFSGKNQIAGEDGSVEIPATGARDEPG